MACARPHSCAVLKRDCLNIRIPAHATILSLTGLYNDAITGSETDYGTYAAGDTVSGNIPSDNVSWGNVNSGDGKWSRSA